MAVKVIRSLEDMLGKEYVAAVSACREALYKDGEKAKALLTEKVDFYPEEYEKDVDEKLDMIGKQIVPAFENTNDGAPTDSFRAATKKYSSPLGGKGYYRLGEDGKLYFSLKCEHYHTSLGLGFPGYKLIENAHMAGIPNATHNNTRGFITRTLEKELIRVANSIEKGDEKTLEAVIASKEPHVLNRVINLETGSLAVEAGVKMMLARFYKLDASFEAPKHAGKTPVFFVMGDFQGDKTANYHGTTVLTQTFRGLWPEFCKKANENQLYDVVTCDINDIESFKKKLSENMTETRYPAGLMHEIVLMNYGGVTLDKEFIKEAHRLCHENDIPVLVDEIQSCIWYDELYLYKLYELTPDFVIIGKGFSGGEYPASKILTTCEMDTLNQFGALVTNGQEELASLSYLITMEYALANAKESREAGEYYFNCANALKEEFPQHIDKTEGIRHLMAIHFKDMDKAMYFAKTMNAKGVDMSAQGYKKYCLPAVLTKPPLTLTKKAADHLIGMMRETLETM